MFSGSRKSSITKLFVIIVSDKKPFRKNSYSVFDRDQDTTLIQIQTCTGWQSTQRENCPNMEFFLVRIFPYSIERT